MIVPMEMNKLKISVLNNEVFMDNSNYTDEDNVLYFYKKLKETIKTFNYLNTERQIIMIYLCSIYGWKKFLEDYRKVIFYLETFDYYQAAHEIIKTDWAKNNMTKAKEVAMVIEKGEFSY